MKVRVTFTLDIDEENFRYWHPLLVERAGGVREAARQYAYDAIASSQAARSGRIALTTKDA